ncbi:MAG: hypothetical protein LJE83_02050 [Gammaproteobacteria bacterium]|nr:hypothetical protein [Gammaproteobacteria bacterium]
MNPPEHQPDPDAGLQSGRELTQGSKADLPQAAEAAPDSGQDAAGETAFFPVSEDKLFTLYITSFGLYGIYWFYNNWKLQQPMMDKKIYPAWRAIFAIFFTHALFRRIDSQAFRLEHRHRFNANAQATFYVITIVASHIIERIEFKMQLPEHLVNSGLISLSLILFILSVFPLLKAQATANRINNDLFGYLNHKYSLLNYLLISAGAFTWLLLALGLLFEFMGMTIPE